MGLLWLSVHTGVDISLPVLWKVRAHPCHDIINLVEYRLREEAWREVPAEVAPIASRMHLDRPFGYGHVPLSNEAGGVAELRERLRHRLVPLRDEKAIVLVIKHAESLLVHARQEPCAARPAHRSRCVPCGGSGPDSADACTGKAEAEGGERLTDWGGSAPVCEADPLP